MYRFMCPGHPAPETVPTALTPLEQSRWDYAETTRLQGAAAVGLHTPPMPTLAHLLDRHWLLISPWARGAFHGQMQHESIQLEASPVSNRDHLISLAGVPCLLRLFCLELVGDKFCG